jgi:dienelactone hydrolase
LSRAFYRQEGDSFVKNRFFILVCVALFGVSATSAFPNAASRAQGTPPATQAAQEGQKVTIKAEDGTDIVGLFYPAAAKGPAVLLLHDAVSTKKQWLPYVPAFTSEGYNVLVVDLRGFGETKSGKAGPKSDLPDKDIVTEMTWLRQQASVDADAVAVMGARYGANFAIRGCALDELCHAVVALTPSTDFFGITTEDAIKSMTKDKAVFLIASQFGENGGKTLKALEADISSQVNLMTRMYGLGFGFGSSMFDDDPTLMPMVLLWLKSYNHS